MALRRKEPISPRPPSGDQLEIAHGDQRAIVVEAGGGVRSYSAGGRELLDAYGADEMCKSGRGQVLIPWPNRLQDGSYEFGGQTHQLPLDHLSEHHAIHGLVRWAAWTVREHESDRVVVEHVIHPRPGYPFSLALSIEYRLSGEGLRVATTATNVGAARCPYGCGAHPYLTLGTATIDSLACTCPRAQCCSPTSAESQLARRRSKAPSTTSASRGRSVGRRWTTDSPTSSETTRGSLESSSEIPTAGGRSPSGWTRTIRT